MLIALPHADAASFRTRNFIVQAPTEKLAKEFAELAEYYRREKAIEWLGQKMPDWPAPCPLRVTITEQGAGGATTFQFDGGNISQEMHIEGKYERLKDSVLPHEVTHTVFAHHFRQPVPRWADEGGSVYSEDELERNRHDSLCVQILNKGSAFPLRRLFGLQNYPNDVMVLYAEGYSITRYLVESSDRQTFLNFIGHGMSKGWDSAVQTYYKYRNVEALEKAWIDHLYKTGGKSAVAKNTDNNRENKEDTAKLTTRQSAWPVRPELEPAPVSRGLAPNGNERSQFAENSTGWSYPPARLSKPEPITKTTSTSSSEQPREVVNNPPRNKPAPPPIVLFPPEPIR
jgi:hypothetical protein